MWLLLPAFLLSSLSLSFSPFSHFNHPQPEGLRKEMESQAQPSQQHRSQTPSLQNFNSPKRRGAWAPAYLRVYTEKHLYGDNYNRGSASGRGPTGGDQRHWRLKKKRQRQKHAHYWQQFTRAQFPGGRFPAKFGCRPIKLEIYLLAHTHPANYVRVHFRHLGVYKESREAYRAIRVRVS